MRKISTKLILSFFFLVSLALLISGAVFLISYTQTLHRSEIVGLKQIAADIFFYLGNTPFSSIGDEDFNNLLQEISSYEDVSIKIYNSQKQVVRELTPERQEAHTYILRPRMFPDQARMMHRQRGNRMMTALRDNDHYSSDDTDESDEAIKRWPLFSKGSDPEHSAGVRLSVPASISLGDSSGTYFLSVFRPQRISDDFLQAAGNGFMSSALIALATAIFAGIFLGKKITQPIINLKQVALAMADGEYEARAEISSRDETGDLAESFNILGSRLAKRIQGISNERDSLRNFLADASHELRTPLTTMLTSSEILHEHLNISDPRLASLHQQNHQAILRMKILLDHLLSLSRLQGGIQVLHRENCQLEELAAMALDQMDIGEVQLDIASSPSSIFVNILSCVQVLHNCFENAIHAGASRIVLRAAVEGSYILLSIIDDGQGIKTEDMSKVSKRFYRGENSKGMGLGLAIVEGIIQAHGGRLEILSPPASAFTQGTELRLFIRQDDS